MTLLAGRLAGRIGENGQLAGPNSVFGQVADQKGDWIENGDLVSFAEERVGGFVGKKISLEGSSLAEKLASLAGLDLYSQLKHPELSQKEQLEQKMDQLMEKYREQILENSVEELMAEMRWAVEQHLAAALLSGAQQQDPLELIKERVFSKITQETKRQTKTKIGEIDGKSKSLMDLYKTLGDGLIQSISWYNGNFRTVVDNTPKYVLGQLTGVLRQGAKGEATGEETTLRGRELLKAYIELSGPELLESPMLAMLTDFFSVQPADEARTNFVTAILRTYFNHLLSLESLEHANKAFSSVVATKILHKDMPKFFVSDNYCDFFHLMLKDRGLKFAGKEESELSKQLHLTAAIHALFTIEGCQLANYSRADLQGAVNHLEDILSFSSATRLLLNASHPKFFHEKSIDFQSNLKAAKTLYNLYIGLVVEDQYTSEKGDLYAALDNYLNQLAVEESDHFSGPFTINVKADYMLLKMMIAFNAEFPKDHTIEFQAPYEIGISAFALKLKNSNMDKLNGFVANLLPTIFDKQLVIKVEDPWIALKDIKIDSTKIAESISQNAD